MVNVRIVDIPYNAIYNDHEASSVSEYVHFLSFIKIYLSKSDCDVKIVFHHNGGDAAEVITLFPVVVLGILYIYIPQYLIVWENKGQQ